MQKLVKSCLLLAGLAATASLFGSSCIVSGSTERTYGTSATSVASASTQIVVANGWSALGTSAVPIPIGNFGLLLLYY